MSTQIQQTVQRVMGERQHILFTRLKVGDFVTFNRATWIVYSVNECRAACFPEQERTVSYDTKEGRHIQFTTTGTSINISPNSEIPILKRLGAAGLCEFLQKRKEMQTAQRESATSKEGTDEPKKKSGVIKVREGGLLGYSVNGVIRAMGAAGWTLAEVQAAVEAKGLRFVQGRFERMLKQGKDGSKPPAPLSDLELNSLKVSAAGTVPAKKDVKSSKEPTPKQQKRSDTRHASVRRKNT